MRFSTVSVVIGLALLMAGLVACAGFDMGDIVRVKTPPQIQSTEGLPKSLTLNEAENEYQAWFEDVQREGARWRANIERGDEIAGLLGNLTLTALDQAGPTIAGLPFGGAALPVVTALTGLFIGKRGQAKEKERSFNKGQEVGAKIARGVD